MKRANADITNWVIELRDGALQVQRAFPFTHRQEMATFVDYLNNFAASGEMAVVATSALHPNPVAVVTIKFLPERALLKAVGEIAESCEREYSMRFTTVQQTAA